MAFSSEMGPLLELPGVTRGANPQRLYDYVRFGISDNGTDTFFAHVKQLPPAHYMEVLLDRPRAAKPVRYWGIDVGETM